MTSAAATFELERFAWADGAFQVAGRWKGEADAPLGRARLVVPAGSRRRRIPADEAPPVHATAQGTPWEARFRCAKRPAEGMTAELEVGRQLVVELPPVALQPVKRPARKPATADHAPAAEGGRFVREAERIGDPSQAAKLEALLEDIRSERQALEAAAQRAAEEREAAERAAAELEREREAAERAAAELEPLGAVPSRIDAHTQRRAELRQALELPREPRSVLPGDDPELTRKIAYAAAGALLFILIVLLILVL